MNTLNPPKHPVESSKKKPLHQQSFKTLMSQKSGELRESEARAYSKGGDLALLAKQNNNCSTGFKRRLVKTVANSSTMSLDHDAIPENELKLTRDSISAKQRIASRRKSYFEREMESDITDYSDLSDEICYGGTWIQQLVREFKNCLHSLNTEATDVQLEHWACIIYESMSLPSRSFHSVRHVFDISINAKPIQKLAAFFHDIIYYTIDGGLSPAQNKMIGNLICEDNDKVSIVTGDIDTNTKMVMGIFGFHPGSKLDPFRGLNEFLSAVLAVRCYEEVMAPEHLAVIAACIEATIPFRKEVDGKTPMDLLFERLSEANQDYDLEMEEDDIVHAVQLSADLGNRDLENFASDDRSAFLSNTWNLLPESNISLRNTTVFRISDFAEALKKMTGFFSNLNADDLYSSFRDPEQTRWKAAKTAKARKNIEIAKHYMQMKCLSIAIVAAIAELTGGDAPVALLLGDLPDGGQVSHGIEDLIHAEEPDPDLDMDHEVFYLLNDGRDKTSNFDVRKSPLAAYIYSCIGKAESIKCLDHVEYPMTEASAMKLLRSLPRPCVLTIVSACSEIAITRRDQMNKLILMTRKAAGEDE